MILIEIFQILGCVVMAVGYIPQAIQTIKTRSCDESNIKQYMTMVVGLGMTEGYALSMAMTSSRGNLLFIFNTVFFLLALAMCLLVLYMKKSALGNIADNEDIYSDFDIEANGAPDDFTTRISEFKEEARRCHLKKK